MSAMLEAALQYLDRGWSVFPLRGKIPTVQWKELGLQEKLPTREQVTNWWTANPDAGIGCALGRVSNMVRIDVDSELGLTELDKLGGVPPTAEFCSPAGGKGYLLQYMDGAKTCKLWKGSGKHQELRVQSDGAYTVLPPSTHPDVPGNYAWINDTRPASLPKWLRDKYIGMVLDDLVRELRPTIRAPERAEIVQALEYISPDDYDRWVQVGMALKSAGEDYYEVWDRWSKCSSKYVEGECSRKWNSFSSNPGGLTTRSISFWAEQGGWISPNKHEPLTDLGNARILSRMGECRIKHSSAWGWLAWDGKRWQSEDAEKNVVEIQKKVLEYRLNRAIESLQRFTKGADREADDYEKQKKKKLSTLKQIRAMESEARVRGARVLAESEPTLSTDYKLFNSNPWLLNCLNGTLDLRTGELKKHDADDLITQLCPTSYVPDARCPRWESFLHEVFCGDTELIGWMQKLLGYCLTGLVTEHVLPIMHGVGGNGKSTLIKTVLAVLGADYACTTPSGYLVQHRGEQHPTKLVVLYGKRFAVDLETKDGAKLDEELVKRLTGGDEISARRMHENFWKFEPTHKLFLCTNYEPKVRGMDNAIWRRLRLIPFKAVFDDANKDPNLEFKLQGELPGILRWMVEGCSNWRREQLGTICTITDATNEYRASQDTITRFYEERIEKSPGLKTRKSDVVGTYRSWCIGNGLEAVTPKAFGIGMQNLGVKSDVTGKYYEEIKIA